MMFRTEIEHMFGKDFVKGMTIDSLESLAKYVLESEFSANVPASHVVEATRSMSTSLDRDKVSRPHMISQDFRTA